MSEETKSAGTGKADEAGGGGGNKLLLIITVLNFLLSIGVIAIIFVNFKSKKEQQISDIAVESEHDAHGEAKADAHGDAKAACGDHGGGHGGKDDGKKESQKDYGKYIKLDEFMVNLNTIGSVKPQFFKVNIELLVKAVEIEEEVKQKMPQVRNTVIDLVNSKKPADVATVEGRDHLKEEIKNALNTFLTTGKVSEVFFTNYVL